MMENDEETDSKQDEEKITEENEANNKMEKSEQKCTAKKGRFFFNKGSSSAKDDGTTLSSSNGPTQCTHEIIIKDMCGNCGKDLRIKGGFSGDRIEQTNANVSMIHHVPELVVSNEIANELGARDHENILRQRKLILLVDLDQTLIHTSNRPPKPSEVGSSDMFGYQIFGSTFFTKLRPYTRRFLEKINKLYEMHIVTYGQRMYAHKIAELLDPNRIYFEYRILSRDELLSSMHKCGNLKALFPCSEQLILMLDDRPDVWMHSEALIRIKPYRFFSEIGDINAPSETEYSKKPSNEQKTMPEGKEVNEEGKDDPKGDDSAKELSKLKVANQQMDELSQPSAPISDDDNSLEHAERILNRVHSLFYQQYEREKKVPDVKRIVGWMRQQVLAGERIVFSGIVPLGVDIRASEIHRLCTQFGAKVDEKIVEGQTTVLVAGRAATEKMLQANRMGIPIVNIQWLGACFERWQKVEKQDFLFNEGEKVKGMPPNGKQQKEEEINRKRQNKDEKEDEEEEKCEEHEQMATPLKRARLSSESMSLDQKMDHFAQMDTLNKKALHEMEDEVASALSEESEDEEEDEDEEGEESSSSAGEDQLEDDGKEESRHGKPWEDQIAEGDERYGEEGNDEEEETGGEYWQEEAEQEENDDEENCQFDYGNDEEEETTRDVELDEDEDELYDEMAADIEQQLNDDGKRNEEKEEEDEDE